MSRVTAGTLCLVCYVTGVAALDQPRPDFSGIWVSRGTENVAPQKAPPDPQGAATAQPPSFGLKFTVQQSEAVLTVRREFSNGGFLITDYDLTGKESRNLEGPENTVSVATWNGAQLRIVTRDSSKREMERVIWLEANGVLVVETRVRDRHYKTFYQRPR